MSYQDELEKIQHLSKEIGARLDNTSVLNDGSSAAKAYYAAIDRIVSIRQVLKQVNRTLADYLPAAELPLPEREAPKRPARHQAGPAETK